MSCMTFITGDSMIHRLDPRGKIIVATIFAVFIAVSRQLPVLAACVFLAIVLTAIAHLPRSTVVKRLFGLNLFALFLWVMLPITTKGASLFRIGPLQVTRAGLLLALAITLKGNSIVLIYTALLSTSEIIHLGHALSHLHVPDKLTLLFLFTVRYVDVIHHEYRRLRTAMKARCFQPRMDVHTYRTVGYLTAMLLARSLDRSERIATAMKCRGFNGRFHVVDHFSLKQVDAMFGMASLAALVCLMLMESL